MEANGLRAGHDNELVRKALDGDERAFARIVEGHHGMVFSVVRAILGNRDDVEDTVQEIFIKVYRNLVRFRGESKLSTWICRIAHNESINAANRIRHDHGPLEEAFGLGTDRGNPDRAHRIRKMRETLEKIMSELDEQYRVVLELRYMGEKSYIEIAEIMEIPIGTVKTYIHRAKAALKAGLTARERSLEVKGRLS